MDKTIKELYVSPELESLEMAMEAVICQSPATLPQPETPDF